EGLPEERHQLLPALFGRRAAEIAADGEGAHIRRFRNGGPQYLIAHSMTIGKSFPVAAPAKAVRDRVGEPVQRREPRRSGDAQHHVGELRPHHRHADGRSGRSADRAVLASPLVLSEPGSVVDRGRLWRAVTAGGLLVGYTGYYVCRSNLSVAGPLLLQEF